MSTSDIKRLEKLLEKIEKKIDDNSKITSEGFKDMSERVGNLEIKEATRAGRESVTDSTINDIGWKKILAISGAIVTIAVGAAMTLVQGIFTK